MLERCPMRSVLAQVFGKPFEIAEQTSQEAEQTCSVFIKIPGTGPEQKFATR
jgi:hypothetical protein